jgi:hypothetical protein
MPCGSLSENAKRYKPHIETSLLSAGKAAKKGKEQRGKTRKTGKKQTRGR